MVLPTTYAAALALLLLSMLCWGSWANTYKLAGRWRFELFYADYALGVMLAAALAALTLGSFGEGFTTADNLSITMKTSIAYCLAGGVVFNVANLLLVAAISVGGMAVAFPVGIGLALVVGVVWNHYLRPQGSAVLLFAGAALVVVAIVLDAVAYRRHAASQAKTAKGTRNVGKGILLSLVSGLLMGSFYPLVEMGRAGDLGLRPYAAGLVFAVGVLFSTPVLLLYFLNIPVQGDAISFRQYFTGSIRQHGLGVLGGAVWYTGTIANFAASSVPPEANVGPAVSYAIGQGATMVSALWGLLVWREFAGAKPAVRGLLAGMLVLFAVGLALVSLAPLYGGPSDSLAGVRGG